MGVIYTTQNSSGCGCSHGTSETSSLIVNALDVSHMFLGSESGVPKLLYPISVLALMDLYAEIDCHYIPVYIQKGPNGNVSLYYDTVLDDTLIRTYAELAEVTTVLGNCVLGTLTKRVGSVHTIVLSGGTITSDCKFTEEYLNFIDQLINSSSEFITFEMLGFTDLEDKTAEELLSEWVDSINEHLLHEIISHTIGKDDNDNVYIELNFGKDEDNKDIKYKLWPSNSYPYGNFANADDIEALLTLIDALLTLLNTPEIKTKVSPQNSGTITILTKEPEVGKECKFKATAGDAYNFGHWEVDGEVEGTSTSLTIKSMPRSIIVKAVFEDKAAPTVTITFDSTKYVVKDALGNTINSGDSVEVGTLLLVTPTTPYTWEDGSSNAKVIAAGDTFPAVSKKTFTISWSEPTNGSISALNVSKNNAAITSGSKVEYGDSVKFTATPNSHYVVDKWSNNATTSSITVSNVTADTNVSVTFKRDSHKVTFSSNDTNMGTVTAKNGTVSVTSGNSVTHGTNITFTATAKAGYKFKLWSDNSTTSPLTIAIESDTNVVGTFEAIKVTSVSVSPTSKELNIGDTTTLTVTVLPTDANDKLVTWSSSNSNVATVDLTGKVTAITAGSATITATAKDGSGKKGTCTITVVENIVTGTMYYGITYASVDDNDFTILNKVKDEDNILTLEINNNMAEKEITVTTGSYCLFAAIPAPLNDTFKVKYFLEFDSTWIDMDTTEKTFNNTVYTVYYNEPGAKFVDPLRLKLVKK